MKKTPLIAGTIALFLGVATVTGIHQAESAKTACSNAKAAYVAGYKADVRSLDLSTLQAKAHSACGYFDGVEFADPVEELRAAKRKAEVEAEAAKPAKPEKLSWAECEELESKWSKYNWGSAAAHQRQSYAVERKLIELRDYTEAQIHERC